LETSKENRWMPIDRRTLLAAAPLLAASPALAEPPIPALGAYERASGGRIGLHARNVRTGATLSWRADERFVMCSTFKASAAACTLARVDRGQERLETLVRYGKADLLPHAPVAEANVAKGALSVAELCAGAVEVSDNTCANLLLARLGGPAALTAFWRAQGDAISRLDHDEPVLNRSPPGDPHDTTTPAAMAGNLRRFLLGPTLSPASRARLTDWMAACKTGGDRLRAGLPGGWRIADKTGNNGKDAAGDIAVAWPAPDTAIVICAYTQGGGPTAAQLETVFAEIGRAVGRRLA
jgi:beta-lactamase class A